MLESKRREWRDKGVHCSSFRWQPVGGKWTSANKGVVVDAFRAMAVGKEMEVWCKHYRLPMSCTFYLSLYREREAALFCEYWVSKMHRLYEEWQAGGASLGSAIDPACLREWQEPAGFATMVEEGGPAVRTRAKALRAMMAGAPAP